MRTFRLGALVDASRGGSGVLPAAMSRLASQLKSRGADALFVRATPELAIEPITLLAAIAGSNDLVLGAVVPLASGRNPAIVAKLATTLALIAPGRCALIFEDETDYARLREAVVVAKAMMGDGPITAGAGNYGTCDAFNEPRPSDEDRPAVGALVARAPRVLIEVSDLVLVRDVTQVPRISPSACLVRVVDERASTASAPLVVEISGGDVDHIAEVVARIAAGQAPIP